MWIPTFDLSRVRFPLLALEAEDKAESKERNFDKIFVRFNVFFSPFLSLDEKEMEDLCMAGKRVAIISYF
jgi:hypothetical protein